MSESMHQQYSVTQSIRGSVNNTTTTSRRSSVRMHLANAANVNLFEVTAQDKAPKKDFCQLIVNKDQVIFRRWIISLRVEAKSLRPVENKYSHEDFLEDDTLQADVSRIFGPEVLNKARCLCEGRVDWLAHMPLPILLYIISFLDIVDVANLSQVNSFFRETCNSDIIWEELFFRHNEDVSEEVIDLGMERGWKEVFFASKLHLRVLLSRRQREKGQQNVEGDENENTMTDPSDPDGASTVSNNNRRCRKFSPRRSSTPRMTAQHQQEQNSSREPLGVNDATINTTLSQIDERNETINE
ncbi:F-box only protein 36-like [Convolutriloba macropyga]|uniref:F-box only protein 36-like n=1 Tax=Convolutriloba macropyga TaxID=536237 RepID=UPI003F520D5C